MKDKLLELEKLAISKIESIKNPQKLEEFRVEYLGKEGS